MGFVKLEEEYDSAISTQERELVHEAYEIIEKYEVNVRNICIFLLGLIGVFHINPINFEEGEELSSPEQ